MDSRTAGNPHLQGGREWLQRWGEPGFFTPQGLSEEHTLGWDSRSRPGEGHRLGRAGQHLFAGVGWGGGGRVLGRAVQAPRGSFCAFKERCRQDAWMAVALFTDVTLFL